MPSLSRSCRGASLPHGGRRFAGQEPQPRWMFPPAQRSGTVPSLSGQSQRTIFYATIFVVGSNGLVSGTSAGSKTPFVGVHTTQLASRCRLLKPQPGTAFQVWLRTEKKIKPSLLQADINHALCSSVRCILCKKQELAIYPHAPPRFPKSYF